LYTLEGAIKKSISLKKSLLFRVNDLFPDFSFSSLLIEYIFGRKN
jgi:hypothetical protein